jgi:hypothetical protein
LEDDSEFGKENLIFEWFGYIYSSDIMAVVEEITWPLGSVTWIAWRSLSLLLLSLDVDLRKRGKRISIIDLFRIGFTVLESSED